MKLILLAIAILAGIFAWQNRTYLNDTVNPTQVPENIAGNVTVYGAQWCSVCTNLKGFLTENNIPFTEYDIDHDDAAYQRFKKLGGQGIPLSVAKGQVVHGYNPGAIVKALMRE